MYLESPAVFNIVKFMFAIKRVLYLIWENVSFKTSLTLGFQVGMLVG